MSCPYAYALGVPRQGVHGPRIPLLGLALNDTLMTIGIAIVTAYMFDISFLISFAGWFILGEVMHYIFASQTAFLTAIGIDTGCK